MPVTTRSVASKRLKKEFEQKETASEPPVPPTMMKTTPVASSSKEIKASVNSVQRAEALERLAQAKLDEARAVTALAEAEVARIDAQSSIANDESDSVLNAEKSLLVQSWLETQPNMITTTDRQILTPHHRDYTGRPDRPPSVGCVAPPRQDTAQVIDVATIAAALTEAARATRAHALPKYFQDLPYFSGASSEWLAYRAAYRDTHHYFSRVENMVRLRRSLRGPAMEAAKSLFFAETEPEDVMRVLEVRFGRPDALVMAEMERVRALPKLTDNARDICVFSSRISNVVAVVQALHKRHYLYNPETVRAVVDKMTAALKYRWYDYAAGRPEDEPDLIKLSCFLSREAELCSQYAAPETNHERPPPPAKNPQRAYTTTPETTAQSSTSETTCTPAPKSPCMTAPKPPHTPATKKPNTSCPLCEKNHLTQDCTTFKDLTIDKRWETAKEKNLCFRCLKKRSFRHRCQYKACGIEDCKGSHNPALHNKAFIEQAEPEPSDPAVVTAARPRAMQKAFLKIVPVTVRGPTKSIETFALLDEGSTVTLVEDSIAQAVGATGPNEPFDIEGVAGALISASSSTRVSLHITGRNAEIEHKITARTINKLHLAPQTIDEITIARCVHLQDITHDLMYQRGTPTLLIGQDNWNLIVSRSIRSGVQGQPAASLTELGWVLHGITGSGTQRVHNVSRITVHTEEQRMEELMKNFFDLDAIGIEPKHPKNDPNDRALTLLQKTSRRLPDGRYETGLLWRNEEVVLPNNRGSAMSRLEGIERKLDRDNDLKLQYNEQMSHLLESGYSELATTPPTLGRTWYLPHFAVVNPTKPKPRIVLDAAARTRGTCLNDVLLTGPDLLQSLPGILMRFRQRLVAVTGDIKEMFLRISMRQEDRDALRFLWRGDRREGPATEYRMCSVVFGAASSPCTAIYIKNRNAEECRDEFPRAVDAICRNHYMDDWLQSFDTTQEAIGVAAEVDQIHRKAKFYLQKWASNRPEVLQAIAPEQRKEGDEVNLNDNPTSERTLGLVWRPNEDVLSFNLNLKKVPPEIVEGKKIPTKREALKTIMSLFDPLGLITPVTMPAKRLLQDAWRLGVGWDNELPAELNRAWLEWLGHMKRLSQLAIPRCYTHYADAVCLEMHIFVDASDSACVAVVYWRVATQCDTVHLSLAMAKGKVAPLKTTSIPRLELQAAVLGCRLARTVETEHDLKPARRVFWSDSRTVLAWLRAGPRTYKPFVAHRVAEIEEATKVSEWRWVPTALNVADDATRGTPSGFGRDHRWFRGPDFLYHTEESWPREPETTQPPVTGEERVSTTTRSSTRLVDTLPEVTRFSSWLRLIRATARVLQFIERCRAKHTIGAGRMKRTRRVEDDGDWKQMTSRRAVPSPRAPPSTLTIGSSYVPLEGWHMDKAEKLWWKATQEIDFEDDLYRLQRNQPLERSSQLRALSIRLNEEGVIHLKSRIDSAPDLPEEQRTPPVLDGGNPYTRLYIAWIHKKNHHAGTETVVNEVRSRLWILRLRPATRTVVRNCIKCRILRAKPCSPATGDHPYTRLAHHQRPFSFVGLDYFGPCSVTIGRRHEKRYVALFTCLTTRAVHLEVAGSLSTDSAIMALRRMMARRGCPSEIHSDNGTNLRGADAELRRAAHMAAKNEATIHAIRWRYIPPGSPFMGGAWERLVQSVKRALAATLSERHPTEEVLMTLLLEAEYTVNNRPLTPVSTSPEDPEALTPLHFLLGGPARVPVPGSFNDADLNARHRWRHTQRLADFFWARWIKEYAPLLQNRREPYTRGRQPQVGDVVLLIDETLPRNTWPRGRVIATYPGKDNVIRVVDVKTKTGQLRRATKKLIVLTEGDAQVHGGRMCTT